MHDGLLASVPAPRHVQETDLSTCAQEPIHIPGSIQPNGVLLAVDESRLVVEQASANVQELLGIGMDRALGAPVQQLCPTLDVPSLTRQIAQTGLNGTPTLIGRTRGVENSDPLYVIAHRCDDTLILELERVDRDSVPDDPYATVRTYLAAIRNASSLAELSQLAAEHVRRLTGFDRVLIYKFDTDWNGHVIAECKDAEYGSYADLWFPASDIPPQARRLYEQNRLRLISDASYAPVPILPAVNPRTGRSLDLSLAFLRAVSPVHIEYLHNMGVASSMSMSLLTEGGQLWGLIACHNRTPRFISFPVRSACDLLAQVVSSQVQLAEQRADYERRLAFKSTTTRLLASMAEQSEFLDGLLRSSEEFLAFGSAAGAAVLYRGHCTTVGDCPPEVVIWQIVDWLVAHGREEIFHTDCLPTIIPETAVHKATASGVLALSISKIHRSYVLWFRPELIHTVKWGGDPRKAVEETPEGPLRISPRKSFETWKERVEGRSAPWHVAEIEAAAELRNAIIGVVLRKAEELAQLSEELQRSNRELEAFSYSVSHDLRAPFRHIVGFSELLKLSPTANFDARDLRYIDTIIQSANFAGTLVDNLLSFSQVGRARLKMQPVDTAQLVREVIREVEPDAKDRRIEWQIGALAPVRGDVVMLRSVWQNLIQNAIKYTKHREQARIQIDCEIKPEEIIFRIADNGIGFEQAYAGKLFGIFQRLHRMEDFEGTGIGLANVRRIISRHNGKTWAEGQTGVGATFFFSLPNEVSDVKPA